MISILIVILLLIGSGFFSGLNIGLMSLNPYELKRKGDLGDKKAKKVYELRKHSNQLLTTLIIGNVAINSTIAIFLDSITSGIIAALISTAIITLFGEIVPQSLVSKYALEFSYRFYWLIKASIWLLTPVALPIGYLLTKLIGQELPSVYSRREIVALIAEHSDSDNSDIKEDEEKIASGALLFGSKQIKEIMTPSSVVYSLSDDETITRETLERIVARGYSRIPVLNRKTGAVEGIVYAYNLIIGHGIGKKVRAVASKEVLYIKDTEVLDRALKLFIKSKRHMFVVTNYKKEYVGVVTIEDILEEIIGKEIIDEFDEFSDNQALIDSMKSI